MKAAAKGILLCVLQLIVILALVLVTFTGAIDENVTAGNTTDGVWSNISDDILSDESSVASLEVWNGTYNEAVVLDKRLTLYSRYGANVTIVDAQGSGNALTIKADSCTVDGFMATGNGHYPGDAAIKVKSHGNIIVNNSIQDIHTMGSSDIWNSSSMITYAYNDSQYTGYIGNYWRDYCSADTNNDGVGYEPYSFYKGLSPGKYEVASGYPLWGGGGRWENDSYPLIRPFTFYVLENVLPIIDFTVSVQEPEVKKSVTFNASSCFDPDGAIILYQWDFGDGNITSTAESIITHFFRSTGNYTVTLTVTDNSSAISSTSKVIAIPMPTVHNLNTSEGFYSIQAAIDDSNTTDGHTIEVDPGTYEENVKVNKSVTIRATSGNYVDTIVQANDSKDHVFTITAESVKLSGFTIKDAKVDNKAGIHISSSNNRITGNNASSNCIGIALSDSRENKIINNIANSNSYAGFALLFSSDNNTIEGNNATDNEIGLIFHPFGGGSFNTIANNSFDRNYDGISILSLDGRSNNNVIVNNSAIYNYHVGLFIINSSGNIIEKNNFSYTEWYSGIEVLGISCNNKINNNVANSNGGSGIYLLQSYFTGSPSNNTITNNSACFNKYSGIQLTDSASHNTITNNSVSFNNAIGIALFRSCDSNIISNNKLYSNLIGLSIKGADISNNQIMNNTVSLSNSYGIWLADIQYTNAITNNNISKSDLFGIFVLNSTNNSISDNTANLNERGIGLNESSEIRLINNSAESNEISGFSLRNSNNNILVNNSARNNTYEGIYLSNSCLNTISNNSVSSSYFGISVYSSNENEIINNAAESNYYFEVFLYNTTGNNIINNTWYTQENRSVIHGVRLYVPETLTRSLQAVEPETNATYKIIVENLGNMPDTFDLEVSSFDNPDVLRLDNDFVTLNAGENSAHIFSTLTFETRYFHTIKENVSKLELNVGTIKLNVRDAEPGIYRAKVEVTSGHDNTVKDAFETWTIVIGSDSPELIEKSSKINESAIITSPIENNATINRSAIINSTINNSIIEDSIIYNSTVIGTKKNLSDVILEDAFVNKGYISRGNITINGTRYKINTETRISDLVIGTDYHNSSLVGIKNKTLINIEAKKSNISFDIRAEDDYFAGSLSVQKSSIPPDGIPECGNNVGGYVYANASDNLANSTDWLRIYIYYDPKELGDLNERSLRLRYFNETADAPGWEDIPISGINPIENYVWGNISHFSTFMLTYVYVGGDGGICPLPDEIIIIVANRGNNTFNFEWLGHDITKVSIDLKSMKINAKVALKKIDKPSEIPDPPGILYSYFDIFTNLESENIHATTIHFRVHKSWTVFNDVNVETIKLWRYTNGWEELETAKIKEDDNHLHFCAETKGFSLFAITSEKRAVAVTPTAPTPTPTAPTPTPTPTPTAPTPTPPITPTASPIPSLTPLLPTMGIRLLIIAAIAASAMIVSVAFVLLRRRKKKLS
uniref:PKD domain-containing protein n=1 Tax=Candidatus Methanophaga sp. ANME-1 ERB7 TaxID=2759913 RepID=A0A7G9Z812_9EURY|nr:hypothetical protein EIIOIEJP_00003 [Methanosarcinales archaeon ANME-1 ERB7]